MPFLIEEARARVELLLGWAVLRIYSQCCKGLVTEETWSRLQAQLQSSMPAVSCYPGLGHQMQRLCATCLGPVRRLANVPSHTNLPALWFYGTHYPSAQPLRRVRVEHITVWSHPRGCQHDFGSIQDAFLPHGLDDFLSQAMDELHERRLQGWRHIRHQPFGSRSCAEFCTTTVRVLWRGFHVELAEQKRTLFDVSSSESTSGSETESTSRSRSRSSRGSERP